MPSTFNTSAVQNLDTIPLYAPDPQKTWAQAAADLALQSRASYRALNGALILAPVGSVSYVLNETDPNFSLKT